MTRHNTGLDHRRLKARYAEMKASLRDLGPILRFGPLIVVVALMLLVFSTGWHKEISLENIVALRDRFQAFLAANALLSVFIYVAIYVCVTALSVPGALILTATGGLLFGGVLGGVASVFGATIGATIVFLVARTALGEALSRRAAPTWLDKLRSGFRKEALSYLLFLRLVPAFPFWFVNLAPAILGVPLKTYVIATFFGIIPGTFAFAFAGAGLDSVIAAAKAEHAACLARHAADCALTIHASLLVTRQLMVALILLGIVALIPVAYKKWRRDNAAVK